MIKHKYVYIHRILLFLGHILVFGKPVPPWFLVILFPIEWPWELGPQASTVDVIWQRHLGIKPQQW